MSFSIIGALMALVPAARRALAKRDIFEQLSHDQLVKHVGQLNRSRQNLIEHIETLQTSIDDERSVSALWRDEARRLRIEVERLNQGAHRCQHQADLNRAMAQQAQAYPQMAVGLLGQQGLGQMQYAAMQNQQAACHRALEDCGMHRAETAVARLNDLMRNF